MLNLLEFSIPLHFFLNLLSFLSLSLLVLLTPLALCLISMFLISLSVLLFSSNQFLLFPMSFSVLSPLCPISLVLILYSQFLSLLFLYLQRNPSGSPKTPLTCTECCSATLINPKDGWVVGLVMEEK